MLKIFIVVAQSFFLFMEKKYVIIKSGKQKTIMLNFTHIPIVRGMIDDAMNIESSQNNHCDSMGPYYRLNGVDRNHSSGDYRYRNIGVNIVPGDFCECTNHHFGPHIYFSGDLCFFSNRYYG